MVRCSSWYADGRSPRWIAAQLNHEGVPSPGAPWNRTSTRLNAKRTRGWVCTAIHGDRTRGTGILNNPIYIRQLRWNRSHWKRGTADSKQRKWILNDDAQVITHQDERLRILPQSLWDAVQARQQSVKRMTVKLRSALNRGRLPRHLFSGLLTCAHCGGVFRCVNGREYGCASHRDGGDAACANGVGVRIDKVEDKLLGTLVQEMLSPEGLSLPERSVREHLGEASRGPKPASKPQAAQVAKKQAEIEQLRALMKAGTLSQAVAQAGIEKAEEEVRAIERIGPEKVEKQTARIIRMLTRVRGCTTRMQLPRILAAVSNSTRNHQPTSGLER
jgi:hypothetical protein